MKQNKLTGFLALGVLLLLLTVGAGVTAQTSAGFDLEWHVIGGGGRESTSASYHINGTIGQSIASQPMTGSAHFTISSGYWFADGGRTIYLPAILKN